MIVGQLIARKTAQPTAGAALLAGAGFVALFVAFFSSLFGALLGIYLLIKTQGIKLTFPVASAFAVAALSAYAELQLLERHYFAFPSYDFHVSMQTVFWMVVLATAGYLVNRMLRVLVDSFHGVHAVNAHDWRRLALVASVGLSLIYILGGPQVQFTGNEAIAPVYNHAAELGLTSLLVIMLAKILAIAWSHAMGFRGGLVFPVLLVAAAASGIASLYVSDLNPLACLLIFVVGVLAADRRTKVIIAT